jgi:hypothetical protein
LADQLAGLFTFIPSFLCFALALYFAYFFVSATTVVADVMIVSVGLRMRINRSMVVTIRPVITIDVIVVWSVATARAGADDT